MLLGKILQVIRFCRLTPALLDAWLVNQTLPLPPSRHYRLRVWREDETALSPILSELIEYFDETLEDARKRIRGGFEDGLSPFNDPARDPAANYPALLHRITLQGYLGETLGALAVEHWGAHGYTDWIVPALLFRFHNQEFQHLDQINVRVLQGEEYDPDQPEERRPGRTGDDGLAFRMNERNAITDILILEAKCLADNRNEEITDAHRKLAQTYNRSSGIRELINILEEYNTPEAQVWQQALIEFWRGDNQTVTRHDGIAYACGRSPQRGGRIAWMSAIEPDPAYTATRNLDCMEFQFTNLSSLVDKLYRGN